MKVYGEREWKTRRHGYQYRLTCRKLHITIDIDTQEIKALVVSTNDFKDGEILDDLFVQIAEEINIVLANGAYKSFGHFESIHVRDAEAVMMPRRDAKIRQHGNCKKEPIPRYTVIREIKNLGRKEWKAQKGYHLRSLVETVMYRLKTIFGDRLSARTFDRQVTELTIKCSMLNKCALIGMPEYGIPINLIMQQGRIEVFFLWLYKLQY